MRGAAAAADARATNDMAVPRVPEARGAAAAERAMAPGALSNFGAKADEQAQLSCLFKLFAPPPARARTAAAAPAPAPAVALPLAYEISPPPVAWSGAPTVVAGARRRAGKSGRGSGDEDGRGGPAGPDGDGDGDGDSGGDGGGGGDAGAAARQVKAHNIIDKAGATADAADGAAAGASGCI